MNEAEVKAEGRLYALEWATAHLWKFVLRSQGLGPDALELFRRQAIAGAQAKTFAHVDAAVSDHLAAEMELAIDRILRMAEELLHPHSPTKSLAGC